MLLLPGLDPQEEAKAKEEEAAAAEEWTYVYPKVFGVILGAGIRDSGL